MNPEEFFEQTRRERSSTLIVIACSGSKRSDDECAGLIDSLDSEIQEKTLIESYPSISDIVKDYRFCTKTHHPLAVEVESKSYPSFIRYSGRFYKSIEKSGINTWQLIERENWIVLILSSYYGFLLAHENIQDYNLQISKLRKNCARKLPEILTSFLNVNHEVAKVLFFTSKQYTKPFAGKLKTNTLKISLLDKVGEEIVGPYGKYFYSLLGHLFCALISGEAISKIGNVNDIVLQRL